MGEQKTLMDHGITPDDYDKESQSLPNFSGKALEVISLEFKTLGKRDGVIMTLKEKTQDNSGDSWDKVHTSTKRIVEKLNKVKIADGDSLVFKVISGANENGTWYDIQ